MFLSHVPPFGGDLSAVCSRGCTLAACMSSEPQAGPLRAALAFRTEAAYGASHRVLHACGNH